MKRQRYLWDPELRAYVWTYVDHGPMATGVGRERPLIRTFTGGSPSSKAIPNGGSKVKPLKGLGR